MTTLNITIGGLCMLVQNTNPTGLWILMPNLADEPTMRHCAMLIVDHDDPTTGGRRLYSLAHQHVDLSSLRAPAGPVSFGPKPNLFEASKYAGNIPVDPAMFAASLPPDLIARIRLPLGLKYETKGDKGNMFVMGFGNVETVGRVKISFKIRDDVPVTIPVAGTRDTPVLFNPPLAANIDLTFINAPRPQVDFDQRIKHKGGDRLMHPMSYYALLPGDCGTGKDCPEAFSTFDVGDADDPGYSYCPIEPEDLPPESIRFIDPINCSVGLGCPTSDPC